MVHDLVKGSGLRGFFDNDTGGHFQIPRDFTAF